MKNCKHEVFCTKIFTFEAAHKLPNYMGDCKNLHGHSYKCEVTFKGIVLYSNDAPELSTVNPYNFIAIDFKDISKIVSGIIDTLDHSYLNDVIFIPTAENIAIYIFKEIERDLVSYVNENKISNTVSLVSVKVWETENSYAEYKGGDIDGKSFT